MAAKNAKSAKRSGTVEATPLVALPIRNHDLGTKFNEI
jgi:hypothetical protein